MKTVIEKQIPLVIAGIVGITLGIFLMISEQSRTIEKIKYETEYIHRDSVMPLFRQVYDAGFETAKKIYKPK